MLSTADQAADIASIDPRSAILAGPASIDHDVDDAIAAQTRLIQPISAMHRSEVRVAIVALAPSVALFLAVAPFAKTQLGQLPAFVPMYVSALTLCDLITAALLFSQFSFIRSWSLLILAGGYLFSASITTFYALIFPGIFAPTGLLGAGPQTTSAMYMFWHAGFPVIVIVYALLKKRGEVVVRQRRTARLAILTTIVVTIATTALYTAFATAGRWASRSVTNNSEAPGALRPWPPLGHGMVEPRTPQRVGSLVLPKQKGRPAGRPFDPMKMSIRPS